MTNRSNNNDNLDDNDLDDRLIDSSALRPQDIDDGDIGRCGSLVCCFIITQLLLYNALLCSLSLF